jgi:MFS superfamily sulfate permease-like transporter
VGALWGSSHQAQTGPTNVLALLVLSSRMITNEPGTVQFVVAAGVMAVMVAMFQLVMGLLRLGVLVNFVSHSVIVGFASGAGVLIAAKQLRHLLGLEFESHTLVETIQGVTENLLDAHQFTTVLGIVSIVIIVGARRINPKLLTALIAMAFASICSCVDITAARKDNFETLARPRVTPRKIALPLSGSRDRLWRPWRMTTRLISHELPGTEAVVKKTTENAASFTLNGAPGLS